MSIVKKKWTLLNNIPQDIVSNLARDINVPEPIATILVSRGIKNKKEAKAFFIPELKKLYDPFLMKNMDVACERLIKVINEKEKILIFGDYDVDGTSGVSMLHTFLNELEVPSKVFIPDRFTDGYGLSSSGIEKAAEENIKLIVAIDCGITANEKVEYAEKLGIDIIICDHHNPPEDIPDAFAVLDTLQPGCGYPFKYLCGTGVAFKLIQAVCIKLGLDNYTHLIDFAAVATAADMVPVIDENRILLHFGFNQIVENPRPSFHTLIQRSGFKQENICTSNVVFALGPRINAVGRLGDATRAVEFLTCDDLSKVEALASVLEFENKNRKKIDSEIYIQAQNSYENYRKKHNSGGDIAIILHNSEWHPGVLGIIASRMVEKYYRPSIILTTFNGHAKGSARSINNFNMYDALRQCSEEFSGLVQFGGHYHAAGLEVELDRVDEFRDCFNRVAKNMIELSDTGWDILTPELKIDAEFDLDNINKRLVHILQHFEPFGPSNMTPIFMSTDVQVVGVPRIFNGSTCVFKVRKSNQSKDDRDKAFDHNILDCVYYQSPSLDESDRFDINTGDHIDIAYSVEENHWNDRVKTQLRIRDLKKTN
jgi:single-stranded-DNA-specific exonuclease